MNEAYLHVILNHFPYILIITGAIGLIYALLAHNHDIQLFCMGIFVVASLITIPVYISGEGAEKVVKHIPGIDKAAIHDAIEDHEGIAKLSLILSCTLGMISIGGIFFAIKNGSPKSVLSWIIAISSIVVIITISQTMLTGGKIMHKEIHTDTK